MGSKNAAKAHFLTRNELWSFVHKKWHGLENSPAITRLGSFKSIDRRSHSFCGDIVAANIEFKARLHDPDAQEQVAESIAGIAPEVLFQRDTFFHVPHGRLKLREISGGQPHLIQYFREDQPSVRRSDYVIAPVADPMMLIEALDRSNGIRGVIRKVRKLWLVGNTRIHFDAVDGVGNFVELEVVLDPDQSDEEGHKIAVDLMNQLDIRDQDIVDVAYIDLLESCESVPLKSKPDK